MKTTLSLNFLTEMYMSEVSPYRDDHAPLGQDCDPCDAIQTHDAHYELVRVLEEAQQRAEKLAHDKHMEHGGYYHGCTTCGSRSNIRVLVKFPDYTLSFFNSFMLENDLDKWSDWEFEIRGPLMTAARRLQREVLARLDGTES